MKVFACTAAVVLATAVAQKVGTLQSETHPSLPSQVCTAPGVCTSEATKIVVDGNWRWTHSTSGSTNCYTGNTWNTQLCPDNKSCAANCALEGADYAGTYGVTTSNGAVTLKFVTYAYQKNVGSRLYLLQDDATYKQFKLLNKEFAFDVDVSQLPCGINGALYFTKMDADGGMARFPTNLAGAKYGTGYCDAQCARDMKFISGEANSEGWVPSKTDPNSGTGSHGSCCAEMDIWEANSMATAFTSHPCLTGPQYKCMSDTECGQGDGHRYTGHCDMDGCDFNPFRLGDKQFYGAGSGYKLDTTQPMTVVTQFITNDGTDAGYLKEIRRVYKQNGVVVQNSKITVPGVDAADSLTEASCSQAKKAFGDFDDHAVKGGLKAMGEQMRSGMTLVMSLWDDHAAQCLWLDSAYPTNKDTTIPGVLRGLCDITTGVPSEVESKYPNAKVTFSNIKVGAIGSTIADSVPTTTAPTATPAPTTKPATTAPATTVPATTTKPATTTAPTTTKPSTPAPATTVPANTAAHWAQCGGQGWTGPTVCAAPYTCVVSNQWYSQCL